MKAWTLLLSLGSLSLSLVGCGQTLDKEHPNFLTLRREYQTIRTYGCDGGVEAEKKREITEPSTWVRIQPTKVDPSMIAFSNFKVLNTNDSTGMNSDLFSFYIHTADTVLGYRVTPGKNQVKYNFWGCRVWSHKRDNKGRAMCDERGSLLESGIVEIDVTFEELLKDDIADVRPDASLCEARAEKASGGTRSASSATANTSGTR